METLYIEVPKGFKYYEFNLKKLDNRYLKLVSIEYNGHRYTDYTQLLNNQIIVYSTGKFKINYLIREETMEIEEKCAICDIKKMTVKCDVLHKNKTLHTGASICFVCRHNLRFEGKQVVIKERLV